MAGKELSENEVVAATIVGSLLDGFVVPRDGMYSQDGSHDFDVLTAAGRIALEVTAARDGAVLSTLAAAFRRSYLIVLC
jgi:hypothetical protein